MARDVEAAQSERQSSGSERPRHWNYTQADVPDFASFAEPFSAGWNAHRREGDVDGQAFARLLMDAHNASGAMLAHKVATGEEGSRSPTAQPMRRWLIATCPHCGDLWDVALDAEVKTYSCAYCEKVGEAVFIRVVPEAGS